MTVPCRCTLAALGPIGFGAVAENCVGPARRAGSLGGLGLLLGTTVSAAPPKPPNCLSALVSNPECQDDLVEEATSGCPLFGDCATLVQLLRTLSADSGACADFIARCSEE